MGSTLKRHDDLAEILKISEMDVILDGLNALANSPTYAAHSPEMIWDVRRLIGEASATAMRNEYAGDYDYPQEGDE